MVWESSDVVRFDLGHLLQGQTMVHWLWWVVFWQEVDQRIHNPDASHNTIKRICWSDESRFDGLWLWSLVGLNDPVLQLLSEPCDTDNMWVYACARKSTWMGILFSLSQNKGFTPRSTARVILGLTLSIAICRNPRWQPVIRCQTRQPIGYTEGLFCPLLVKFIRHKHDV